MKGFKLFITIFVIISANIISSYNLQSEERNLELVIEGVTFTIKNDKVSLKTTNTTNIVHSKQELNYNDVVIGKLKSGKQDNSIFESDKLFSVNKKEDGFVDWSNILGEEITVDEESDYALFELNEGVFTFLVKTKYNETHQKIKLNNYFNNEEAKIIAVRIL